jgi:hypothetical protein
MIKLNALAFRMSLAGRLMAYAMTLPEGSSNQDAMLLGAAKLERGEMCPRWIAAYGATAAFQDAYGAVGMTLTREEIDAIFDSCIER